MEATIYAKIFEQIYNSSIAEDYLVRLVFEDFLVLADINGVVDITTEAFARRTNVPIDVVKRAITILEAPDKAGRGQESEGRRIIRLDESRDWGWMIVKYDYYRKIGSEEQRREKTAQRVRKHREKVKCNASVTVDNALPYTSTSIVTSTSEDIGMAKMVKLKEDFDAAWKAYPSKTGSKDRACQSYKNAKPDLNVVLAGIQRYKDYVKKRRETDFKELHYQNGATFFNQRGWDSEWTEETGDKTAPAETDDTILRYAAEWNRIGGFSAELEDVDRIRVVVEDNCGGSKGWTRVIKAAKQLKVDERKFRQARGK